MQSQLPHCRCRLANIVSDRESATNVTAFAADADCAAPSLLLLLPPLWLPNQKQKLHKPQLCDRRVEAPPPPSDQLTYAQQHVCVWEVGAWPGHVGRLADAAYAQRTLKQLMAKFLLKFAQNLHFLTLPAVRALVCVSACVCASCSCQLSPPLPLATLCLCSVCVANIIFNLNANFENHFRSIMRPY